MLLSAGPTGLLKWESNQKSYLQLIERRIIRITLKAFWEYAEVLKAHFENSSKFSGFFNLYNEHDLQK